MPVRHPRYTFLLAVLVLLVLFLLLPDTSYSYNSFLPAPSSPARTVTTDLGLPARVARAERIYQKMLAKRKGLINKFGPNVKDIVP